jgi:hypothetical protein
LLVEGRDILQVGLILQRNRDLKFVPLDTDDERAHVLRMVRGKWNNLNHLKDPRRLRTQDQVSG